MDKLKADVAWEFLGAIRRTAKLLPVRKVDVRDETPLSVTVIVWPTGNGGPRQFEVRVTEKL